MPARPGVTIVAAAAPAAHWSIVEDAEGVYVCVLRRGDDLADLRAEFSSN